jgi:hypothetical protein
VGLPAASFKKLAISTDGETYTEAKTSTEGGFTVVDIDPNASVSGILFLKKM